MLLVDTGVQDGDRDGVALGGDVPGLEGVDVGVVLPAVVAGIVVCPLLTNLRIRGRHVRRRVARCLFLRFEGLVETIGLGVLDVRVGFVIGSAGLFLSAGDLNYLYTDLRYDLFGLAALLPVDFLLLRLRRAGVELDEDLTGDDASCWRRRRLGPRQ